jgi:hypothetical protein
MVAKLHVERRPLAGEVLKPKKERVDAYALVESKTGLVLRWSLEKGHLEKEFLNGNAQDGN